MRGNGARSRTTLGAMLLFGALLAGCSSDPATVRIGVLADCVGFFRNLQDVALSGASIPLLERGATLLGPNPSDGVSAATIAGHPVELLNGCIEGGEYSSVIEQARLLVEVDHVDVVVGGTYPGDGLALRAVASKHPEVTFVVSNPGDREVTAIDAAPNIFRFAADISQQVAGLGTYAFQDLGWRKAVVIADNNEAGWGGAAAFLAEFCGLGGTATQVPMSPDRQPPSVPDADGVVVFFAPFGQTPETLTAFAGGRLPLESSLLLGPGVWNDLNGLSAMPQTMKEIVTVVPTGGTDLTNAASQRYRAAAAEYFPGVTTTDAMQPFVVQNHDAVEAVMTALERTGGSVGTGGADLRQALGSLHVELVSGSVRLDANRAAVVSTSLVRLADIGSATVIRTIPDVDQTLGGTLPASYEPSFGEQPCVAGAVATWAR